MISEIKQLARALLQEEVIIASWGISKIEIENTNLRFRVDGLKYNGLIDIKAVDNGKYEISFGNEKRGIQRLETIISFLDKEIEKTDSYHLDLEKWINKKLSKI